MGDVLEFKRHWVWFFNEPVTCDYCLQETRGKVFERDAVDSVRQLR